MKTIGYAIVGTGYFGAELGRIMAEQEGAKIVAVLDPENGAGIAKEFGCEMETDLDVLCSRPDVDAVIVATPNYLHKEPVLAAARHGKNVFCEKPIALSYADCDEMVRACEEAGVTFMAGHVMNFFRSVRHAKQLIAEGKIGRVLYAHSARNGWEEPQESISWKKIRAKSGGHLYHHIHELDCIQFIMGPATEVTMTGFCDDEAIPTWARSYAAAGVAEGIVQGKPTENGAAFSCGAPISYSEAATVLNRVLDLGDVELAVWYADREAMPSWAAQAVGNMEALNVLSTGSFGSDRLETAVTRADAARMLSAAGVLLRGEEKSGLLDWLQ